FLLSPSYTNLIVYFFFFLIEPSPPKSSLFPYTTLFRSEEVVAKRSVIRKVEVGKNGVWNAKEHVVEQVVHLCLESQRESFGDLRDGKSTRLNSSHVSISYAVFCLKKKNK